MIPSSIRCEQAGCKDWAMAHSRTCLKHKLERDARNNAKSRQWRGSAAERGYDSDWAKLSAWYRKNNPLCEQCMKQDKLIDAVLVDHRVPVIVDPARRLDGSNLQSLCVQCHAQKTREDIERYPIYKTSLQQKDVLEKATNPILQFIEKR